MYPHPVKSREGVGKVFVILVLAVVTVAVSMSGAVLMGGTCSFFSRHEQVEVPSAFASRLGDGGWVIEVKIRNTGSVDATLDLLSINGKAVSAFDSGAVIVTPSFPFSLRAGSETVAKITVRAGTAGFITGATVDVGVRSSSGTYYPKTVMLL